MNDLDNPQMGEMCTQPKVQSGGVHNDTFREVTPCFPCPCGNIDVEQGEWCNLDFETANYWTENGGLLCASEECSLVGIVTKTGTIHRPKPIMARVTRVDRVKP